MAVITPASSRVDTFALTHNLSEQDVVRWNLAYFQDNRTMWLPVGQDFRTEPPPGRMGADLDLDGNLLMVNRDILTVTE